MTEAAPNTQANTTKTSVYALTPALVSNESIDYGTAAGAKIYKQATEKLKTEYDLKMETIHIFLAQMERQSLGNGMGNHLRNS